MWSYIGRNVSAIFRIYAGYEPLRVFTTLAILLLAGAVAAWGPFLWDWLVNGRRDGHLQSVILGGVLTMAALQMFALGVLADLIASHRIVTQRTLERVRRIELELGVSPSHYLPGRRTGVSEVAAQLDDLDDGSPANEAVTTSGRAATRRGS
jgi:hypothetical protein